MNKTLLTISGISLGLLLAGTPTSAVADGCAPGEPCWDDPAPKPMRKPQPKPAPVAPPPEPVRQKPMSEPEPEPMVKETGGLEFGIAAGFNVLFFDCEDTHVAPALYVDAKHSDVPLNLRLGVEGVDLADSEQYKYTPESQWFQEEPNFSLIRLPLSLEYVHSLAEKTELLVGGGPDLLILGGEAHDTTVGVHLGARVRQALSDSLGVSAGGGYLWGEGDVRNEDYDLGSAFVGADLSYRF